MQNKPFYDVFYPTNKMFLKAYHTSHFIWLTSLGQFGLVLSLSYIWSGLQFLTYKIETAMALWLLEHLHSASNMYVICREGPPTSCLSDPLPPLINVPIPSAFLFSLTLHTHYCRKDPHVVLRMAPNAFSDEFGDTSSDSPYLVTNLVMNFANLVNKNKSQHRSR